MIRTVFFMLSFWRNGLRDEQHCGNNVVLCVFSCTTKKHEIQFYFYDVFHSSKYFFESQQSRHLVAGIHFSIIFFHIFISRVAGRIGRSGPWLGSGLCRSLLPGYHADRPYQVRPSLRAIPQPGPYQYA